MKHFDPLSTEKHLNTSLAAPEHSLTACNTAPPGGPKMADGVWKGVQSLVIGRSNQLLLNKFFDPSTPSMSN